MSPSFFPFNQATFCGSSLGKRAGYHFNTADFESMGYHLCDTLLDYCDPDDSKVPLFNFAIYLAFVACKHSYAKRFSAFPTLLRRIFCSFPISARPKRFIRSSCENACFAGWPSNRTAHVPFL